jgi:hypothetical protein
MSAGGQMQRGRPAEIAVAAENQDLHTDAPITSVDYKIFSALGLRGCPEFGQTERSPQGRERRRIAERVDN